MHLAYLDDCKSGDLMRFRDDADITHWAIVGRRANGLHPIAVLSGENAPFIVNATEHGHTIDIFDTFPVLNYGNEFELRPSHEDEMQIGDSPLLRTKGALVITDHDKCLVSGIHGQSEIRYFSLNTGDVRGKPGGMIATFKIWSLVHPVFAPHQSITLLKQTI